MASVKFKSLSSGSCGNCYFLGLFGEDGKCEAGVLIDAGVSPRRLKKELLRDSLGFDNFDAILVTHDHMDHIHFLGSYCKHVGKPVWASAKLHGALSRHPLSRDWIADCRKVMQPSTWTEIVPGRIKARWFEVPHDATQTVGYAILLDDYKFVIMTDIGRMTPEAMSWASQADTVVIESNYDLEMLRSGPYPPELQDRICLGGGHLSNAECAAAIKQFWHEGLRNIFLCHLSEHNNTPTLALAESRESLDSVQGNSNTRLCPLPRQTPSPLFNL